MRNCWIIIAGVCLIVADAARAEPGLADKVEGARINEGVSEVELRHGRITGGERDGADASVLELSHGFSDNFYGEFAFEFASQPNGSRRLEGIGIEGVVELGHNDALNLDFALYGEYVAVRSGADEIEAKLLIQHSKGPFDARLNLIAEREFEHGEPVELAYAVSTDWQVVDGLRVGAAAFGELGTTRRFLSRGEHFAGPVIKTEIEGLGSGDLEIEAGYHFALGSSREGADGQMRLVLEYEFRF